LKPQTSNFIFSRTVTLTIFEIKNQEMLTNRELFFRFLAQTSDAPLAIEIEHAEGIWLTGANGKKYIDLISGISVSNTGHRHPEVVKAIKDQADRYLHLMVYGEYIEAPQAKLAAKLASLLPPSLSNVYLVNSGSEAVEGALKLAKRYTGRREIVAFNDAYHGSSHGSLSVMGNAELRDPFGPLLPDIRHIRINETADLEAITTDTACVIIEPVQGEAGVITGTPDFITNLRKRCSQTGSLLIFDEVQTGFGRTGSLFAFERYAVIPDIVVVAKGMGGGMPIGAFISSPEIMQSLSQNPALGHITTFGGHPVSCAAAIANLEVIINEKLVGKVESKSALFRKMLAHHEVVKDYRSAGLLIAVELENEKEVQTVIHQCLGEGLILDWFLFNPKSIRIAPPLIITKEEIIRACQIILKALDTIKH
jgi:acetylornithine/succinyldiaminopimelate/putrescine aminotransferase